MALQKTFEESHRLEEESSMYRLQIELSPQAYKRLSEIREKANLQSNTELVRNALRLYEWFLEQKHSNSRIQLVRDDEVRDVELLL